MFRNALLDNGYHFMIIEPKKPVINFLWTAFAALFIVPVLFLYFLIFNDSLADIPLPYIEFHIAVINAMFIVMPAVYLILKEATTSLFCYDRDRNIELKLHSVTDIPINAYREAFKSWQLMISHSAPSAVMYPLLIATIIMSGGNINLLIVAFIMSFLMAFDFALATYILFVKLRHNAGYIALNNHIYSLTLYSKTYVKTKKAKNPVKININMKKIAVPAVCAGIAALLIYHFISARGEFLKITMLYPFDGAAPEFTGGVKLAGGGIIHCGDDGSVIYSDGAKSAVMRLDAQSNAEKLCVNESCRADFDARCGHMPDFLSIGAYSDGVLYGAQRYGALSYIVRYDIKADTMDKIAGFEMGDENAHIHDMFIYSGFLYAAVSADDKTRYTVVKIDLAGGDANVVYSDRKNPQDGDRITNLILNPDTVFSSTPPKTGRLHFDQYMQPANGMLYRYDLNADKFAAAIELGYETYYDEDGNLAGYTTIIALQADIYGGYIYYTNNIGRFCRYNTKTKQKEELAYGITDFYIDGDWLYYFMSWKDTVYKVKLDGVYTDSVNEFTYIDFANAAAVYSVKEGERLDGWGVKGGYIYTLLYSYSGGSQKLSRSIIGSSAAPHIFW